MFIVASFHSVLLHFISCSFISRRLSADLFDAIEKVACDVDSESGWTYFKKVEDDIAFNEKLTQSFLQQSVYTRQYRLQLFL